MKFKALPPGVAQRIVQDYEDALTPLAEEVDWQAQRTPCPRCEGPMQATLYGPRAFVTGELLPRTSLLCADCGCVYDPRSDLILDTGNPAKIEEALPIVRPPEE